MKCFIQSSTEICRWKEIDVLDSALQKKVMQRNERNVKIIRCTSLYSSQNLYVFHEKVKKKQKAIKNIAISVNVSSKIELSNVSSSVKKNYIYFVSLYNLPFANSFSAETLCYEFDGHDIKTKEKKNFFLFEYQ